MCTTYTRTSGWYEPEKEWERRMDDPNKSNSYAIWRLSAPLCCHAVLPKDTIVRRIFNTRLGTQFSGFPPQRCDLVPNDLSDWLSLSCTTWFGI